MPATSGPQYRAMQAAAHGSSTIGIPKSVGQEFVAATPANAAASFMGMPSKKKKTHRGRKPSGKPGAKHLDMLTKAHAAGDHATARTHALNYAKATMNVASSADEPDDDDMGAAMGATGAQETVPNTPPATMAPTNRRAQLAKLAMRRTK